MSLIYLLALAGVAALLLVLAWEAVRSVSRLPDWSLASERPRASAGDERRRQALPYVGTERRQTAGDVAHEAASADQGDPADAARRAA